MNGNFKTFNPINWSTRLFDFDASARAQLIFLLVVSIIVISAGIGIKDPWPADEPRFALVAKEMVESGQWFFPTRGGEFYPDKPPLFMWLIAFFYLVTGSMRVAHLLPSLIAGVASILLVYDLGRRLWCRRTGLVAGLILLVIFQFSQQAKTAQIDALLCFWTTLGMYGFFRHMLTGPDWRWFTLGGFAMGLGVITKGVGILPWLLLIPYTYGALKHWNGLAITNGFTWKWTLPLWTMFAAISLWLIPMLLLVANSNDPNLIAFRDNILFHQTADRYAHSWGHIKPFYYFVLMVIPWAWFPVTLALPWLIPAWITRMKRHDGRYLLLLGWIFLVIVFFSISPGKRGLYILPATPALALAVAPLLPGLLEKRRFNATLSLTYLIIGIVLIVTGITDWQWQWISKKANLEDSLTIWPLIIVAGVTAVVVMSLSRFRHAATGVLVVTITFWLMTGWWGYALINPVRSTESMMQDVGRRIGTGAKLAIINWREQYFLYADRPMTQFGYHTEPEHEIKLAAKWLQEGDNRWLLLTGEDFDPCFDKNRAIYVALQHRQRWYLINHSMVLKECDEKILDWDNASNTNRKRSKLPLG